jgi:2-polyprenyl-3-methyl-5-hydroxy-6-metoxy-1,4-benzoquinol methylase
MREDHRLIPCVICGGTRTTHLYTKFELETARCDGCGLVYANPRGAESIILSRYDAAYFWNEYLPAAGAPGGTIDLPFLDSRHRPMLDLIRRHAPMGRRLLDVGCGAGLFLKAAERAGWEVGGVELSAEGATFARERLGLDVRAERAEAMSFPAGSFDVAVMSEVIEHMFDPRAVVNAVARALKPGGLIAITTPNFDALSRHALGADWAVLAPMEHMYYFTERTLGRLLESCGFAVVESRPVLDLLPQYVMNADYTHAPRGWRARVYRQFVRLFGSAIGARVQRAGRGDTLVCLARAAGGTRE